MIRTLFLACLTALALLGQSVPSRAQAPDFVALVDALNADSFPAKERAVLALAASGDERADPILRAFLEGDLYAREDTGEIVIGRDDGARRAVTMVDPLTGEDIEEIRTRDLDKIRVNNGLRRAIRAALGAMTLMNPDPARRLRAAEAVFRSRDASALDALATALDAETDPAVRTVMEQARDAALLNSDADQATKVAAIESISARGDRDALSVLSAVANETRGDADQAELLAAAEVGIAKIERSLALWSGAQNVWFGISLGSVLLLAAIGLAITFGVMGVINMAHGEMVMLGAYTTYVVQETIRTSYPELFGASLFIALPLAFLVAGAVGVATERGIIRWLYGRPLETLLATWGLSLVLQQTIRTIFGPTNREVGTPDWMSGAFEVGQMTITYNRLVIVIFALLVFAGLVCLMRFTRAGLQMRAVTQNRPMAASMGIRTG
ncbi:MAG: urea ABC transporter permease subunit UrtB, partial [Pseudomonadota bacterium]